MRPLLVLLSLFFIIFVTPSTCAQKRVSTPGIQRSKPDTLLRNITNTIQKISAMIADPKVKGTNFAGRYLYTDDTMFKYFSARQPLNGGIVSYMTKGTTSRNWKQAEWVYRAVVARVPAGTATPKLAKTKALIDSLLKTLVIPDRAYANDIFATNINHSIGKGEYDSLYFSISFFKEPEDEVAKTADAVIAYYLPGLIKTSTAASANGLFKKAIRHEDLISPVFRIKYISLVNTVGRENMESAFRLLLDAPFYPDHIVINELDQPLRPTLRTMANKVVDDYNKQFNYASREVYVGETKTTSATSSTSYAAPVPKAPTGKRVKCDRCLGQGHRDYPVSSHTYNGIYNTVQTNVTQHGICDVCNGEGWVTVYKK